MNGACILGFCHERHVFVVSELLILKLSQKTIEKWLFTTDFDRSS